MTGANVLLANVPGWPMGYLKTAGPRADPATALTWGLIALSLAVIAIVTVLVVAGILARRRRGRVQSFADLPVAAAAGGVAWFAIGTALTVLALTGALVWTVEVLAAVDSPPTSPRLTIEISGHQWWWEIRYRAANPAANFVTANEIHIPTGEPVAISLTSPDVIHSFWIPALTGKTDAVPGQTNIAWIQADHAGVYRGACAEYCGLQHAHMALVVVAQPPSQFEAWREAQARPAVTPTSGPLLAGEDLFAARCGACHAVRGSPAGGAAGPDLTHLMSRGSLAAGAAPNTVGALSGWIANPQALKPGTLMPTTYLSGAQLSQVVAYLETLR